jgi:ribosome assembly protein YihI (activator of Der GTPase)
VQLVKSPVKPAQRKYATPAEELAALEADGRLSALLDKLDEGKTLTAEQQRYVDEKMARHRILCDLMGIRDDEDEDDDDLDDFDKLDSINIDDYTR